MAKPKNTRRQHFSRTQAIALHAEANKSDSFAAKRMAMTLARHPGEINEVAKESKRILDARDAAVRKAYAEWVKSPEGIAMREFLRSGRGEVAQLPVAA